MIITSHSLQKMIYAQIGVLSGTHFICHSLGGTVPGIKHPA